MGRTVSINVRTACFWAGEEKFLNAKKELSVHTRNRNDVCFCEIKAERMAGRRKGSVSVGMASGHCAVSATESNTDE